MGKTSSRSEASTRADQKFEKKLQFYSKVRDTVAQKTIVKKKKVHRRTKKLKAYDLSSLSEFLPELKQPPVAAEFKLSSKSRQNLVLKEGDRMKTVLSNPSFQSDPLAAIHEHLQCTQPVTEEKPVVRKLNKSGKKKKTKRKKSKASAGAQSMEA